MPIYDLIEGNVSIRHIVYDQDIFDHEISPTCPCGPSIETNFIRELGQGLAIYLHPVLLEEIP